MPELSDEQTLDVAEYVLGLLDPAERVTFERRLRQDVVLKADYHRWITLLSGFDTQFTVEPPSAAYPAVSRRLFGPKVRRRWPLWAKIAALVVAATIIAVKLVVIVDILHYLGL